MRTFFPLCCDGGTEEPFCGPQNNKHSVGGGSHDTEAGLRGSGLIHKKPHMTEILLLHHLKLLWVVLGFCTT